MKPQRTNIRSTGQLPNGQAARASGDRTHPAAASSVLACEALNVLVVLQN